MSCRQSLLEQLLSQPHDEALKVSSAWRANYAGNKRVLGNPTSNIAYGDPPSVSKYDPKVYEQVFRPPPPMHRDAEKLYGRKFLLRHHPDQYRVLLSNYGEVGKWFAKVDSIGDLRNNLEQKNHVLSIIRDKIGNLKGIVIDGAFYPWKEEDIYSWCIKSLAFKRKYSKKKIDQSMSSSSGSMPINQDLDDEGVGDLHEKVTDLHQDAPLDKTIENAQDDNDLVKLDDMGAIMVHEKKKEEEKSTHEDVEVYIPEIPWENNNEQNDAYERLRSKRYGVLATGQLGEPAMRLFAIAARQLQVHVNAGRCAYSDDSSVVRGLLICVMTWINHPTTSNEILLKVAAPGPRKAFVQGAARAVITTSVSSAGFVHVSSTVSWSIASAAPEATVSRARCSRKYDEAARTSCASRGGCGRAVERGRVQSTAVGLGWQLGFLTKEEAIQKAWRSGVGWPSGAARSLPNLASPAESQAWWGAQRAWLGGRHLQTQERKVGWSLQRVTRPVDDACNSNWPQIGKRHSQL
ncbi:hypothetical protein L7F22_029489 [Adiantum nelumboides]|nr:hypothetical protein [Adiantum nelumboides]